MDVITLIILLIAGAILFALAAVNVASPRVNLVAFGLLLWICVPLIHAVDVVTKAN